MQEAKDIRENPQLNPKQQDTPEETATLKLNIDLHCPLFYDSSFEFNSRKQFDGSYSSHTYTNCLSTGKLAEIHGNNLALRTKSKDISPENFEAGHIMSFYKWLIAGGINYTTSGINIDEFVSAYILPIPLWKFAEKYTLGRFQDKDDNIVGLNLMTVTTVKNQKSKIDTGGQFSKNKLTDKEMRVKPKRRKR